MVQFSLLFTLSLGYAVKPGRLSIEERHIQCVFDTGSAPSRMKQFRGSREPARLSPADTRICFEHLQLYGKVGAHAK